MDQGQHIQPLVEVVIQHLVIIQGHHIQHQVEVVIADQIIEVCHQVAVLGDQLVREDNFKIYVNVKHCL